MEIDKDFSVEFMNPPGAEVVGKTLEQFKGRKMLRPI